MTRHYLLLFPDGSKKHVSWKQLINFDLRRLGPRKFLVLKNLESYVKPHPVEFISAVEVCRHDRQVRERLAPGYHTQEQWVIES